MRWTIVLLPSVVSCALATSLAQPCVAPAERKEWRALPDTEKADYISAVKCLSIKPSKIGLSTSLYEDFPWVHAKLNPYVHFVASFLPWHRWFVHLYETALRDECNYTGSMPYWDWTQDSGALPSSPVFSESAVTGFGGGGLHAGFISPARPNPLTSCVTTGAFANYSLTYYINTANTHCLNRQFNNGSGTSTTDPYWQAVLYSPATVANITDNSTTFEAFWNALENTPHGAIHNVIGGDMVPSTSPNDPLFFLHHSQIDRLWWIWQQKDPAARSLEYSGNKYESPNQEAASLNDTLSYEGLGANITVIDVMSTVSKNLCYFYS